MREGSADPRRRLARDQCYRADMRGSFVVVTTVLTLLACGPSNVHPDPPTTTCDWDEPERIADLQDGKLKEASGLCASRRHEGVLYLHDDSGGAPRVHAARIDGTALGRFEIAGATNVDWEDIACAPCAVGSDDACLYIADVGDNGAKRETVTVYVAPEPDDPTSDATLSVLRELTVTYAAGPRDVEAVLVHPRSLDVYFVSKNPEDTSTDHLVLRIAGTASGGVTAHVVASVSPVGANHAGKFTAADAHPAGTRIVLRTYGKVQEHRLSDVDASFESLFDTEPIELPRIFDDDDVMQREAVAYSADGLSVLTTSEGKHPPLHRWACEVAGQ